MSSPWRQGCRGKYATGVARVAHALAITLAAGANTRAATWPAVPPTSDDASGLIVDWKFMIPLGWLVFGPEPADSKDWGAVGMVAGARVAMAAVLGWLVGFRRS